jgi:hypothetical protein
VTSAQAQALPPGSHQRSCTQIHWAGSTLVAECRRRDGRSTGTGLPDARRCTAEIVNNDGQLQCGGSAPPRGPAPGYGAPPGPDYGPRGPGGYEERRPGGYEERRSGGYEERRTRCEELRERQREVRDRLEETPWDRRERLEYRLRELRDERDRLGCGR